MRQCVAMTSGPASNRCLAWLALLLASLVVLWPGAAAADPVCDGPEACCPAEQLEHLAAPETVRVGAVFIGLYNVDDKAQAWDADYYLYESWRPAPGFTPQTEIVNETSRLSSQFDETVLREGRCVRSRRIHSTLHSRFDLRTFPFDRQRLTLRLADAERDSDEVRYDRAPFVLGLDAEARSELPSWKVASQVRFDVGDALLATHPGAPRYAFATLSIDVSRRADFYLTRFFLPLMLIMVVAFSVFWIHPDDLGSQVGIGVTCLLAVIAFQLGEASTLPAVEYLTLADRVYASSYVLITLALVESVYTNTLARQGDVARSARIDNLSRVLFPSATLLAIVGSFVVSFAGR